MSNAQQQQRPQQQQQWQPDKQTRFLLQGGNIRFEQRARQHLQRKYRGVGRIVTTLDTQAIRESTTIVVVYHDPNREVSDGNGGTRPRRQAERVNGKIVKEAEPAEVLETPPVHCARFYSDGDEDSDGKLRVLGEEGIIVHLNKLCRPARVRLDQDNHVLHVRTV